MRPEATGGYGMDVDGRTLLLGDWTPWVRDGIDVLRLLILGGAVVYAAEGNWERRGCWPCSGASRSSPGW